MTKRPGAPRRSRPPAPTDHSRTADGSPPLRRHRVLKSLLGAWALSACSAEETTAVEAHLTDCAACADEALRLRDAVGLLHPDGQPGPRSAAALPGAGGLSGPPAGPHPGARLGRLRTTRRPPGSTRCCGTSASRSGARRCGCKWFERERAGRRGRPPSPASSAISWPWTAWSPRPLGLADPLGDAAAERAGSPRPAAPRTFWRTPSRQSHGDRTSGTVRDPWREQSHALVRTVVLRRPRASPSSPVAYGDFALPLRDALLDRAFECWVHGGDIAEAVDYPYEPPAAAPSPPDDRPGRPAAARRAGRAPPGRARGTRRGSWSRPARRAVRCTWRSRAPAAATGTSRWTRPAAVGYPARRRSRTSRWTAWSSASWPRATCRRRRRPPAGRRPRGDPGRAVRGGVAVPALIARHRRGRRGAGAVSPAGPAGQPLRRRRPCGGR